MDTLPDTSKKKALVKLFPVMLPVAWLITSTLFIVIISFALIFNLNKANNTAYKYAIFSSSPKVLGASSTRITGDDARAERIDSIFAKYKCPIKGHGSTFVKEADKNNIPYWLVAAIAFQESSCGKNTPIVNGNETYNLYGWGVWGPHVYKFDSMEEGIAVVSKYMSTKFISKGIIEPCDIMKVYTPPSNGSWCKGVKFFRDEILEFETP